MVDGLPWSLQTSFTPVARGPGARLLDTDDIAEGAVAYLRSRGIEQAGYSDAIEVRKPDAIETEYFGIPSDGRVEVTEIYRLGFDQHRNRVRLTIRPTGPTGTGSSSTWVTFPWLRACCPRVGGKVPG